MKRISRGQPCSKAGSLWWGSGIVVIPLLCHWVDWLNWKLWAKCPESILEPSWDCAYSCGPNDLPLEGKSMYYLRGTHEKRCGRKWNFFATASKSLIKLCKMNHVFPHCTWSLPGSYNSSGKDNGKQKAFSSHLAPWNGTERFSGGFCWLRLLVFTDMSGFQSLNANCICFVAHKLGKAKGRNNVPLSAHPHWDSGHSLFRFIGSLSNLWREVSICLAVLSLVHMDSFDFVFQVPGSIDRVVLVNISCIQTWVATRLLGSFCLPFELWICILKASSSAEMKEDKS